MKILNPLKIAVRQLIKNKGDKFFYNAEGVKKADHFKFKEAFECFTKAINLDPEDASSYFNRATVKMEIGDLKGAKSDFALSERFK